MSTHPRTVCLIIPPSGFLLDERVFMTLGILRVAAVLEKTGWSVEMLDLSGVENFLDAAREHAARSDAVAFGLTATTPQLPAAVALAETIRNVRPRSRILLGGPHVTLVHAAYEQELRRRSSGRAARALSALHQQFDVLVAGDGEAAVFQALEADPPSLINADDPRSTLFMTSKQLDELPLPARHLVDVNSYRYEIDGVRALSLIAQLGCPFACGFCGGRASSSFRRVRMRGIAHVVSEIAHLHDTYGVRGFMFYDDELNVNRGMLDLMEALARLQAERTTAFHLRGFVKAELFTDAQAAAMRQAGFRWLLVGFESGSPIILRNINKKATRDDNSRCVEIARRHDLKVKALMSVGHPGESDQTVRDTQDWLMSAKPDDFDLTIITTYPGTPYYDEALPHPTEPGVWTYTYAGDRLHAYDVNHLAVADYYKGDPNGGYRSFVYTDYLSCDDLVGRRDAVEREVRARLGIPFPKGAPAIRYEHSMGQPGASPVLRVSHADTPGGRTAGSVRASAS